MRTPLVLMLTALICTVVSAQPPGRPKLVVGITVDQMRWDYLYRFQSQYAADGGFARLLQQGFSCENTYVNYVPSVTACGHASIYTGTYPAIHGITGNEWTDRLTGKSVYCTQDESVSPVGSSSAAERMSPANLLTTTITDELQLATNFASKVIGIALKDRGSILPAGHAKNAAAYWYDDQTGAWITSTYYRPALPQWVVDFNARKLPDQLYKQPWETLYPLPTYTQSTADSKPYESKPFGAAMPYNLQQFAGKNYNAILATPHGNTLTLAFAKAAIEAEGLGADNNRCDFLTLSFSSTDYVGHTFGPNSVEAEDIFLRLDKDLGEFLGHLDAKLGKNNYLLFLTADHGAAQVPAFMLENGLPGGNSNGLQPGELNALLKKKFGVESLVSFSFNHQLHLNQSLFESKKLNADEVKNYLAAKLEEVPAVFRAVNLAQVRQSTLPLPLIDMLANGYYPLRSGDVQYLMRPHWLEGYATGGTTHGLWNPYDTKIPLLWYGKGIKQGKTYRTVYITDIAPTLASLLHIQPPSGATGKAITELF